MIASSGGAAYWPARVVGEAMRVRTWHVEESAAAHFSSSALLNTLRESKLCVEWLTTVYLPDLLSVYPFTMSELIKKDFGTRVRALREQTGLSTKKFALMVGLSKPYIIQIEHGNRNISLDTIERIAAGLNMTPSELLEGVGSYTRN